MSAAGEGVDGEARDAEPGAEPGIAAELPARLAAAGLLGEGQLVAMLSGGRDSVCLLDLAVRLRGPDAVTVLHANYGLREEAAADEASCVELCERLGVALVVERPVRPEGSVNLQAWARDHRYAAAAAIALPSGARIVTGHTADDQVETILYRLASSPSRRALLGMKPLDGSLARPLLGTTRAETTAYCEAVGLRWREDRTNEDPAFARNRIRAGLLPELRRIHPAAEANVLRLAELLRSEAELPLTPGSRPSSVAAAAGRSPWSGSASCTRRCAGWSSSGSRTAPPAARCPARPTTPTRWRRCAAPVARCSISAAASAPSPKQASCTPSAPESAAHGARQDEPPLSRLPPVPADPAIGETLVSREDLQRRVAELGAEVSRDYEGREPILIGVLKGAVLFLADLMRSIDVPCEIDFMAVSSYGSQTDSSGVVRILKDLDASIAGRDVLIVEDIIDSGLTLQYLMRSLRTRDPASLEVCALLTKPERLRVDLSPRYVGFEIPNRFAIGYGLDHAQRHRNLDYVAALAE